MATCGTNLGDGGAGDSAAEKRVERRQGRRQNLLPQFRQLASLPEAEDTAQSAAAFVRNEACGRRLGRSSGPAGGCSGMTPAPLLLLPHLTHCLELWADGERDGAKGVLGLLKRQPGFQQLEQRELQHILHGGQRRRAESRGGHTQIQRQRQRGRDRRGRDSG